MAPTQVREPFHRDGWVFEESAIVGGLALARSQPPYRLAECCERGSYFW